MGDLKMIQSQSQIQSNLDLNKMPATSPAKLKKMSKPELEQMVKKLEFTVKSRGLRIGALYHTVQRLMDGHPDRVLVERVAEDKNVIESLKTQLTQARTLAQQAMDARNQLATTAASDGGGARQKFDCVVCFEEFDEDEHKPVALSCGHILCEGCCLKQQE